MRKWFPYILIISLALVLLLVKNFTGDKRASKPVPEKKTDKSPSTDVNRNRGFDRRTSFIEYTRHADCRMDCRKISDAEVKEIMRDGSINYTKSDVKARPCPEYALEGVTSDKQRVRIVFAQCDQKTKVVTVIDLDTDWSCACPGDDKKRQSKK